MPVRLDKQKASMYSGEYNFHIAPHVGGTEKRNTYEPEEAVYHA